MMRTLDTICIMCPLGCPLRVTEKDGKVCVEGNTCARGAKYGAEEFTYPKRTVTTLVKEKSGGVCSVKTSSSVPKDRIKDVLFEASKLCVTDAKIGDVILQNVLGLGVDFVVTGTSRD